LLQGGDWSLALGIFIGPPASNGLYSFTAKLWTKQAMAAAALAGAGGSGAPSR